MPEPSDHLQRRRALEPANSFIVQAPAGSGKTELLIQRYLVVLAAVDFPESVVAITFTRKATREMRRRISEALEAAAGPEPGKEHEKLTWNLARAVSARDAELNWGLLENPSRLRVQTFDSFSLSLVRQMPFVSRFGAPLEPTERADNLYSEAARNTLALLESGGAKSDAVARLLRHLDNNFGGVEQLLVDMLRKRDQWLRHVAVADPAGGLRQRIEAGFQAVVLKALSDVAASAPPSLDDLIEPLRRAAANLISEGARDSPIAACIDAAGAPGSQPADLPTWLGLAEILLTQKGDLRSPKSVNVKIGFPATSDFKLHKSRVQDFLEAAVPPAFAERLHALRLLPPPQFSDSQWEVLEALLTVLPVAAAELLLVFERAGEVDFTELATGARRALGSDTEPTDLAFALDYRLRHLLVDEFQDTSLSQRELLRRLTTDWTPGDGRTLFVVGDPMQSIYRFRDAEVGIFIESRQNPLGALTLEPLDLSENFRSDQGVVDWVNEAFDAAFATAEDAVLGAVRYSWATAAKPPAAGLAVEIHPFIERDDNSESQQVVAIVKAAREQDPEGTTAVLARSRGHLPAIIQAMQTAKLAYQAVEIDPLGARPVVLDLLALTRALLDPADRIAWLSILRAPWCGLTLHDLHHLAGADHASTILELTESGRLPDTLSADGGSRLSRVRDVLAPALARRGRVPLRLWAQSTWVALGGPACLENAAALADAEAFLDLLETHSKAGGLDDLEAFHAALDKLYAKADPTAGENLQVMTIHKAKGLQFDTVIVPGMGRGARSSENTLLAWMETPGPPGGAHLLLAPVHEKDAERDPFYDYLRHIDKARDRNERVRLLYVAATRAKKHLHLLGHCRAPKGKLSAPPAGSLLNVIWQTVEPQFQTAHQNSPPVPELQREALPTIPPPPLRRLASGWQPPPPPKDFQLRFSPAAEIFEELDDLQQPTYEWVSPMQRQVGTVAHAIFRRLAGGQPVKPSADFIRAALATEGVAPAELDLATDRVETAVNNTLADERGRWILAPYQNAETELALAGDDGGQIRHIRIDRTFITGGVRWVVDFKLSFREGGGLETFLNEEQRRYRPQLERYGRLISKKDQLPVRLGLYFPLLREWREWQLGDTRAATAN